MLCSLTILGIDPGLAALGWGLIRGQGNKLSFVASGCVQTRAGEPLPDRLKSLHAALAELLAERAPDAVAVEETFVNANQRGAVQLAQARAIALLAPAQAGIAVAEYAPNLVKKSVVGTGHASKEQIRLMVAHLLPGASPSTDHEADALAIAITHAHLSQTQARFSEAMR
jgi:crossover junction endodeoxyribonuclease RuvC